jgi:alkaline phosphatase
MVQTKRWLTGLTLGAALTITTYGAITASAFFNNEHSPR